MLVASAIFYAYRMAASMFTSGVTCYMFAVIPISPDRYHASYFLPWQLIRTITLLQCRFYGIDI
jgi:hypothetical protein